LQNNSHCPYCGGSLNRWAIPEGSTWTSEFQYVCFNDECSYFNRGWNWMTQQYGVRVSYRYRLDPTTGKGGSLLVWSNMALRSGIIQ